MNRYRSLATVVFCIAVPASTWARQGDTKAPGQVQFRGRHAAVTMATSLMRSAVPWERNRRADGSLSFRASGTSGYGKPEIAVRSVTVYDQSGKKALAKVSAEGEYQRRGAPSADRIQRFTVPLASLGLGPQPARQPRRFVITADITVNGKPVVLRDPWSQSVR